VTREQKKGKPRQGMQGPDAAQEEEGTQRGTCKRRHRGEGASSSAKIEGGNSKKPFKKIRGEEKRICEYEKTGGIREAIDDGVTVHLGGRFRKSARL